jgi:hypothetical protein
MPGMLTSHLRRPRLLLLPMALAVLAAPLLFTSSAARDVQRDLHADYLACKSSTAPVRKPDVARPAPSCVNCRAPLLNAPLARAGHGTPATSRGDPSPAA